MNRGNLLRLLGLAPLAPLAMKAAPLLTSTEQFTWRWVEDVEPLDGFCKAAPGWWRYAADGISGELIYPK
jgi:hypothetical protein